jgi:hypothetical protein
MLMRLSSFAQFSGCLLVQVRQMPGHLGSYLGQQDGGTLYLSCCSTRNEFLAILMDSGKARGGREAILNLISNRDYVL